jgi:hypothetical protein
MSPLCLCKTNQGGYGGGSYSIVGTQIRISGSPADCLFTRTLE